MNLDVRYELRIPLAQIFLKKVVEFSSILYRNRSTTYNYELEKLSLSFLRYLCTRIGSPLKALHDPLPNSTCVRQLFKKVNVVFAIFNPWCVKGVSLSASG